MAAARSEFSRLPERAVNLAIQEALLARGYDIGAPDGAMGKRTRNAINAFAAQHASPLKVDGPPIDILGALLAQGRE